MHNKKIITLIFLSLFSYQTWSSCHSNMALEQSDFKIHKKNFEQYFQKSLDFLVENEDLFEDDLDDVVFSSVANTLVHVKSYDYVKTPRAVMWGDIVVIYDWKTKERIEVRWYDKKTKHVAYNTSYQGCVTNLIPMAYNSLM